MNLRRLFQIFLTGVLGQGLAVLGQLLIPPLFVSRYASGLQVYAEWTALSSAANYLGTLNYGVQTYASNQMTILYQNGDIPGARRLQASALWLLASVALAVGMLGLLVFEVPVVRWFKLQHLTPHTAAITFYLVTLQIVLNMFFSLLTNSYMAVGLLHRGNYISSTQRLVFILGTAAGLTVRASLPVLATIQLCSFFPPLLFALWDMRRIAPDLLPSPRAGSWRGVRDILKPSGHFGLIAIAGFLTWQGPALLIQAVLGSTAQGTFSLVRTVFQMSRQILSMASSVFGQDITLMVGKKDWRGLRRLYDLSERLVLFLIPVISIGILLLCPLLFTLWLHKRSFYQPELCFLMAVISAVLGLKEHKTQFQSSSNVHEQLSKFLLVGYSVMLLCAAPAMRAFGITGFLLVWLSWEIGQTAGVVRMNRRLFPAEVPWETRLLTRFCVLIVAAFAGVWWPSQLEANWPLSQATLCAVAISTMLAMLSYFIFDMDEIRQLVVARIRRKPAIV